MEKTIENYDFGLKDANVKILRKKTRYVIDAINVTMHLITQVT